MTGEDRPAERKRERSVSDPMEVLPMSSFALLLLSRCTARTTGRSVDVQLLVTSSGIAGVADQSLSIYEER